MDRNELLFDPSHLGVAFGVPKLFFETMIHLSQTEHLFCTGINTISKRTKQVSSWPTHLGVPTGAPKMIFEPISRSVQTVHLACVKINTMSKWTEMSFHLTHITKEFNWVCPKWFSSLWYGRPKPCTYLAPRWTLSPNGPKWASTWPNSPMSSIRCAHNDFLANCTFDAKACIFRRG
jgi:hypothetical protein